MMGSFSAFMRFYGDELGLSAALLAAFVGFGAASAVALAPSHVVLYFVLFPPFRLADPEPSKCVSDQTKTLERSKNNSTQITITKDKAKSP